MTRSGGALIKLKIIVPILCLSAYSVRDEIRDREKKWQTERTATSETVTKEEKKGSVRVSRRQIYEKGYLFHD